MWARARAPTTPRMGNGGHHSERGKSLISSWQPSNSHLHVWPHKRHHEQVTILLMNTGASESPGMPRVKDTVSRVSTRCSELNSGRLPVGFQTRFSRNAPCALDTSAKSRARNRHRPQANKRIRRTKRGRHRKSTRSARDRKDPRSHQGKDPGENKQNRRKAEVKSKDFTGDVNTL